MPDARRGAPRLRPAPGRGRRRRKGGQRRGPASLRKYSDCVAPRTSPGASPGRALDELAPQPFGILAEEQLLARRQHVPALALDLALELARPPSGETGEQALLRRRAAEERLDALRVHAEIDVLEHLEG